MERSLPAEPFAQEVLLLLAQSGIDLADFASSIGVHPRWLHKVLDGRITEFHLLTVVGLCRALRIMPEDVWSREAAARAFAGWPTNTFDPDGGEP
jgi:DNA-binding Xre family transcriptional regulator